MVTTLPPGALPGVIGKCQIPVLQSQCEQTAFCPRCNSQTSLSLHVSSAFPSDAKPQIQYASPRHRKISERFLDNDGILGDGISGVEILGWNICSGGARALKMGGDNLAPKARAI